MGRESSLGENLVTLTILHRLIAMTFIKVVWRIIRIDLVRAVVLVVGFALFAPHTGLNLGSDSDTISNFTRRDFFADADDLSDDFVTNTQRCCVKVSPSTSDRMDI